MDNYQRLAKVGEGTYGVVYKAVHIPTGRVCAMKKIRLHTGGGPASLDDEDGVPATAIREVACLREIHHRLVNSPDEPSDPTEEDGSAATTCDDGADENTPVSPASAAGKVRAAKLGASKSTKPGLLPSGKSLIGTLPEDHVVQLLDVLHTETRLHLVFEYVECDLRRYMEQVLGGRLAARAAREAQAAMNLFGPGGPGLDPAAAYGLGITVEGQVLGPSDELVDWQGRGLPAHQVKSLTYQLVLGLHHLHSRRMLHRDLKPQNLLISPRGAADGGPLLKIADFGLARTIGLPIRTYTHEIITLYYRPPEVLLGTRHYTTAVDMWSVGCILAEMATGAPLFTGDSELGQIMKIFQILGTPDATCWPSLPSLPDYKPAFPQFRMRNFSSAAPELDHRGLDLLAGCFVFDPARRVSAKEALTMPYLRMGKKVVRRVVKPKSSAVKASSLPKAKPASPGVTALMSMTKAGSYRTPPMSGRPRAPSKLGQSPMTIPFIFEGPKVAYGTTFDPNVADFPTDVGPCSSPLMPTGQGMVSPEKPSPPTSQFGSRMAVSEGLMASPSLQCAPIGQRTSPFEQRLMASPVI